MPPPQSGSSGCLCVSCALPFLFEGERNLLAPHDGTVAKTVRRGSTGRLPDPLLEQTLLLSLPVALLLGVALFELTLALGQPERKLDPSACEVKIERNQRIAGAFDFSDQPADFGRVHQQFAGSGRIGVLVGRSGR